MRPATAPPVGNVIPFRQNLDDGFQVSRAFDRLTATLILDQHRNGTLPEAVIVALLAGAGVRP